VWSVKSSDSISAVLEFFHDKKILAAPVSGKAGTIIGIVNLADVLNRAVFNDVFKTYSNEEALAELKSQDLANLVAAQTAVFNSPIGTAMGITEESRHRWNYDVSEPLSVLNDVFNQPGVHRVLVTDKKQQKTSFISQSDMAQYLEHRAKQTDSALYGVLDKKLLALGLGLPREGKMISVGPDTIAIVALRLMLTSNLQALPVVDPSGALLYTFSATGFRDMTIKTFAEILLTVEQLIKVSPAATKANVTCTVDSTLGEVLALLQKNKVHRAWVLDGKQVSGVVSYTDIIRTLTPPKSA